MSYTLLMITDGRRDCMLNAMHSFQARADSPLFTQRVLVDDSGDRDYGHWLDARYSSFFSDIVHHPVRRGFCATWADAWSLVNDAAEWVFACEDDFVFVEDVPLEAMTKTLANNDHLVQMVLKRQPWSPEEERAGGLDRVWPDEFAQHSDAVGNRWQTHRLWFSTNNSLLPSSFGEHLWPPEPRCEERLGRQIMEADPNACFGLWGSRDDPPTLIHIGKQRAGTGY